MSPHSRRRGATTHDAQQARRPSWWRGTDAWWLIPASVLALLVALGLLWANATGEGRTAADDERATTVPSSTTGLTAEEGPIETGGGETAPPAPTEEGGASPGSAPDSSNHGGGGHAPSTSDPDEP